MIAADLGDEAGHATTLAPGYPRGVTFPAPALISPRPRSVSASLGRATAVEIVADGGHEAGFGHLGRCLALAEELSAPVSFAVSEPDAARYVRAHGAAVGAAAAAPVVLIDRRTPTDAREVERLQAQGRRIVLLDDLGSGRRRADLVVDPPTAAEWPPSVPNRLAGFEHVLVRREILAASDTHPAGHVLLSLGGSDPLGLTPGLARALAQADVDVVYALGPGYHGPPPDAGRPLPRELPWSQALASAVVYVGGYGHSLLEAAYLGVPAVSVVFLAEHLPHARAFVAHRTAVAVDLTRAPSFSAVVDAVNTLLASEEQRACLSHRGRALVDGGGARRVATAVEALL